MKRLFGVLLPLSLSASFALCQTAPAAGLPPAELAKLREQTGRLLDQVANYTCILRIQRMVDKRSEGQKMEEEAHLEVAYIGQRERFSWPGDSRFDEDELRDILVMGLTGSGSFAEHLRTVVTGADTAFGQSRQETQDQQDVLRIPYQVPAARSGYLVNLDGNEIEAAIEGEITVLANTFQILSFSLAAKDLPLDFPATSVAETIRYQQPTEIAMQLPAEASQQMVERGIDVYDNQFRFQNCRLYTSESDIAFTESTRAEAVPDATPNVASLPEGVPMELELESAVMWRSARTGDPVEAVLVRPVKWKGEVFANAGARVLGRIVEFKRLSSESAVGYFVGLQFYQIEDKGKIIPIKATLEALSDMPKSARRGLAAMVRGDTIPFERMDRVRADGLPYPSAGFIRVLADTNGLPAGLAMRWISGEASRRRD